MEDFATPLSHLAEIVQEVQQVCKKERECVCIHKSHFFRETLPLIQTTLFNREVFFKWAQLFWLTALAIIFEMIDYVKSW